MLINMLLGNSEFTLLEVITYIISSLAVIFLTMPVHEWAHAFAATKLGDPTPKYGGRLSLNPFNHIDYMGALAIILFGFGWAKPVQVNPSYFRNPKKDMAITAFAGPLSNLAVAFISLFFVNMFYLAYFRSLVGIFYYIAIFFNFVAIINISLAVFNLIPIPPLDGSKLLAALLPDRLYYRFMQYERYLYFILILIMVSNILDTPLEFVTSNIYSVLNYIPNLIFSLFI